MKRNIIFAAMLLAANLQAFASDYFLVVPVKGKTVNTENVTVALSSATLSGAEVGAPYSYDFNKNLSVIGDAEFTGFGVSWSIANGALPAGLSFNSKTGLLSGTPTAGGQSAFTVRATYMTKSGEQAYQLTPAVVQVSLAGAALPGAQVGEAYTYAFAPRLTVTGDSSYTLSNVTWSVGGTIPNGMQFNSQSGLLSGTPSTEGPYSFSIVAAYKLKNAAQQYQLAVAAAGAPMTITSATWGYNKSINNNILANVRALCNAKSHCSFDPATFLATDPYPYVQKALQVVYTCRGKSTKYEVGGEAGGYVHTVTCP